MKYRLKDQTMQANLDVLSGGDFSLKLQEQVTPYKLTLTFVEVGFSREKGKNTRWFTATFRSEEIEEIPEYNPHTWNEWPGVEPPKDIPLQAELVLFGNKPSEQNRKRDCLTWDKTLECFINDNRTAYFPHQIEKMYFRPWMAPDEEDEE